ncbi:MAG: VIT1/CCC1 transporter family protein [Candidatus Limnocylindrales bacterium]
MGQATLQLTPDERARSLANLKLERDAVVLYDRLAEIEKQPDRAAAFRRIAANERRHAEIWANRLGEAGATVPPMSGPRARVRLIILVARLFGTNAVADLVRALEGDEEEAYASQLTPETASIAADEREHAEIWDKLATGESDAARGADDAAKVASRPARPDAGSMKKSSRGEAWHRRGGRSGTLRAAVFGANDGLVSNLSLVIGVAAAAQDNKIIVLAGIAGLLAGAFSMAAGEYISMQSQRELFEDQIQTEREEMRVMPDVEREELVEIYRGKGLRQHEAEVVADRLMEDPEKALDTMIREELGLDPHELGSPWGAAWSSFVSFGVGAFVPLLPFLLGSGSPAFISALGLSFAALFGVGAGVSLLTGRGFLFSGLRQVIIGAAAAAVTFAVGTVIGANVS